MGVNFIDQYSLLHFATGIIAYFWGISLINYTIIHILFEIIENTSHGMNFINNQFANIWPGGKPYSDSFINSTGDTIFGMLGWLVAYIVDYYGKKHNLYGINSKEETVAINDLAKNNKSDPKDIKVLNSKKVTWANGSLGCPKEGEVYTQALVDGYEILLEDNKITYDYRVVDNNNFKICK